MFEHTKPKLVIAANREEYLKFLSGYEMDEDDYIYLEEDFPLGLYGIVFTGNYKKHPHYQVIEDLVRENYFKIVSYMPIP